MCTLSVIIPTYNRRNSVLDRISRIFDQISFCAAEFQIDLEFIIVDDGSTDGTSLALIENMRQYKNVHVLVSTKNVGPGLARNIGLAQAKNDWIWFLDDDDEVIEIGLRDIFRQLNEFHVSKDLLAHSLKKKYDCFDQLGKLLTNITLYHEHQEVFRYLFKREILELNKVVFLDQLHEDIPFVVEAISCCKNIYISAASVIRKEKTAGAITSSMSMKRVDGYISAFCRIEKILVQKKLNDIYMQRNIFEQTLGLLLYLINCEKQREKKIELLIHLKNSEKRNEIWRKYSKKSNNYTASDTNFKYSGYIFLNNKDIPVETLLDKIQNVFESRLSCRDLDHSLFLGPDEIRACCKRYFIDGQRKGDVVLKKVDKALSLDEIVSLKEGLVNRINTEAAPECSGCPYIERRNRSDRKIDYISFENFSYCNMRCTYCSPKYYGGTESKYNAAEIIQELFQDSDNIADNCHVVWGGGEPTLSPRFVPINELVKDVDSVSKIRILSNSLRYSDKLADYIRLHKYHIVTSVDAGSDVLFEKIRGKKGIKQVLQNIAAYKSFASDPLQITVKYIISDENKESKELEEYIKLIKEYDLRDCLFQISLDFNIERADYDIVCALYELAVRLFSMGVKHVFFDDLVRDRVNINQEIGEKVVEHIRRLGLSSEWLIDNNSSRKIILWGDGLQARWMMENTLSGRSGIITGIIRSEEDWKKGGYAQNKNVGIIPAGVQSMYNIIQIIKKAELQGYLPCAVIL